jgi:hypothetical protein
MFFISIGHLINDLSTRNMIAKNYRIFRIFNNIFITRTIVTDIQLLKASATILILQAVRTIPLQYFLYPISLTHTKGLLSLWLGMSTVKLVNVDITRTSYYVACSYVHPASEVFLALMATYAIGLLVFATFLAIKTRSVGASYTKYSETKQIGMCV